MADFREHSKSRHSNSMHLFTEVETEAHYH